MTLLIHEPPPLSEETPHRFRFKPEQFDVLSEMGMVPEKSELVDGQVFEMPAAHNPHALPLEWIRNRLLRHWPEPKFIKTQATQCFPSDYRPMPDIVLYDRVPGFDEPTDPHPRLIVEIADTTQRYDLGDKRLRYAWENVPEYWVLDVPGRRLHVFREPVTDARESGSAWKSATIETEGASPLCIPACRIVLAEVLPPADTPDTPDTADTDAVE